MNPDEQYISITDFSTGIRQIPSPNHPIGTASPQMTYGCRSEAGMLVAGPKMVGTITAGAGGDSLIYDSSVITSEFRICGVFANDAVYNDDTITGEDQNNTELWVGVEYWISGSYRQRVSRYARHSTTPTWETVKTLNTAGTYNANTRPHRCWFDQGRSNSADPTVPGPVCVAVVFSGWAWFSPDDTTPTVTSSVDLPDGGALIPPDSMITHQNRVIIFPLVTWGANDDTVRPDNEAFYWTDPNDWTSLDSSLSAYQNTVAYVESSTGYEYIERWASDQLLLLKRGGGGLMLQGDMNDFAAVPLPNIMNPGLALSKGCRSDKGFIYPVDADGVWIWGGGDVSTPLSEHMNPNFWRPDPKSPAKGTQSSDGWGHSHTSTCRWRQFALFPRNWIWDSSTGGWWKIAQCREDDDSATTIRFWCGDWTGRWVWGAPSGYTDSTDPVFYEFDALTLNEDYAWASHPLTQTLDRRTKITTIIPVVTAYNSTSSIEIIVYALQPDGTETFDTQSFEIPYPTLPFSSDPLVIALRPPTNYNVEGTHLRLEVFAHSNEDGVQAPDFHALHIGIGTESRGIIPRVASV